MKTRRMIIMRHGEAVNPGIGGDVERALTPKGQKQASMIGVALDAMHYIPDVALVSYARRTLETSEIVQQHFAKKYPNKILKEFYDADFGVLSSALTNLESTVTTVLLVGHNPIWTEVVAVLAQHDHPLATADAVVLEATLNQWTDFQFGQQPWKCLVHLLGASGQPLGKR